MRTVRKVSLDAERAGSDTDYWESEWSGLDLEATRRRLLAGDPVIRLLDRHLPSTGTVLEAGCGSGAVAAALATEDRTVVGLDLASQALQRAAVVWDDFRGAVGDVRRMPFPDRTFDAVVSLGVLEHQESGPGPALREHYRVLRPGGLLLVTVPRISPLKSARDTWNLRIRRRDGYRSRGRWVVRRNDLCVERSTRPFHQYEFADRDWVRLVRSAGFEVLAVRPHLVGAGLGDLPFLARGTTTDPDTGTVAAPTGAGAADPRAAPAGFLGRLKRAATQETGNSRTERAVARGAQQAVGHMVLTVARRPAHQG